MAHRDGNKPATRDAVTKPKGMPPRTAGNRLPPPTRPPRSVRVVAPPWIAAPMVLPPVSDFDETTVVDGVTTIMTPPLPPLVATDPLGRIRLAEPTEIVTPLPPPPDPPRRVRKHLPSPGQIPAESSDAQGAGSKVVDAESTGGQTSGEVIGIAGNRKDALSPAAEAARRRRLVVALIGAPVFIAATLLLVIGFSPVTTGHDVARPERRVPIVEPLPQPPRREPASSSDEPAVTSVATPSTRVAPSRSDRIAPARPSRSTGATHKSAAKPSRPSRSLTYDPDALFLKKP